MKYALLAGVAAVTLGFAGPAMAGNIALTGHDDDLHCNGGTTGAACTQLSALANFVVAGQTGKSILSIDNGTQLTNSLTALGFTVVAKTVGSITAADFSNSLYSAFAVASVSTCGGCDNPVGTGTTLSAFSAAIASFFNAGGGILGLTEASDSAGFAYVPQAVAGTPIFGSSGFAATANGIADIPGFVAVNGDQTHNTFTSSTGYLVAEISTVNANAPLTIYLKNATIGDGTITAPEPMTLSLLGVGLFGLGLARRRLRR